MTQKTIEQKITRESTIGDIVQQNSQLVETLLSFGVHCVGCHVAYSETIQDGFRSHGMTEEEIDEAVKILNDKLAEEAPDPNKPIYITDKAAEKIKELLAKQKKKVIGLRVGMMPGGCSGFQYELELAEKQNENESVFEEKGVSLLFPNDQKEFFKGIKLDYIESLQGAGFKISNPNATSSCGCGNSFSQ